MYPPALYIRIQHDSLSSPRYRPSSSDFVKPLPLPYGRAPKGPYGRACLRILKGPIWSLPDADKRVNLLSLMVFRPYGSLLSFCRASNQFLALGSASPSGSFPSADKRLRSFFFAYLSSPKSLSSRPFPPLSRRAGPYRLKGPFAMLR